MITGATISIDVITAISSVIIIILKKFESQRSPTASDLFKLCSRKVKEIRVKAFPDKLRAVKITERQAREVSVVSGFRDIRLKTQQMAFCSRF